MTLHQWDKLAREEFYPRCTRRAIHSARMTVARIELAQGAVLPEHRHANEQITMLERGKLRFRIDGRELILEAGQAVTLPPESVHGVEALEDSLAIDVFAPAREDWQRGDHSYLQQPPAR